MTSFDLRRSFASTSAGDCFRLGPGFASGMILLGGGFSGMGTTPAAAFPSEMVAQAQEATQPTTAGGSLAGVPAEATDVGASIAEVRRRSGLTWEQLAELFDVSRRSVHFWASGKPMTRENEEHLHWVKLVLHKIDRGSPAQTRSALFAVRDGGFVPFDLLKQGEYEQVMSLLSGETPASAASEMRASVPTPARDYSPDELIGAKQDRVHKEAGQARRAKSVRTRGGG